MELVMLVRTLSVFGLALGLVGSLSSSAYAVDQFHLLAEQLQANAFAAESMDHYGQPAGMDPFAARATWLDLRIRNAGSSRVTGSRLLTAVRASAVQRTPIRSRPPSARVGGLGGAISGGGAPSFSLHGLGGGGSAPSFSLSSFSSGGVGGAPSFGSLHEGTSSFSFSRP